MVCFKRFSIVLSDNVRYLFRYILFRLGIIRCLEYDLFLFFTLFCIYEINADV